ncbi:hypothetical protein Tco_1384847 [Tanacetum coccineum]
MSNFMASQDARLSKFEANFKQQESKMTNKFDTFLKAINDRMTRALPSDTVKNPKLNVLKVEGKAGGEFSSFETVVKETKLRDLERNNLGDSACRSTKEVEEAKV